MDKSSDAFRTISEVAGDLDLPQHVLRFWETRFAQIKPLKRGGGRRYYRPDDVDLLKGIRHLLYGEGYTIKGVQRILKDQGVRFVMTLWQEGAPGLDPALRTPADAMHDFETPSHAPDDYDRSAFAQSEDLHDVGEPVDLPAAPLRAVRDDGNRAGGQGAQSPSLSSPLERAREAAYGAARTISLTPVSPQRGIEDLDFGDGFSPESIAQRFAPNVSDAPAGPMPMRVRAEPPARDGGLTEWGLHSRQPAQVPVIDRFRGLANRLTPEPPARAPHVAITGDEEPSIGHGLSRDDVRRLQATLFELLECKRLLDQTR